MRVNELMKYRVYFSGHCSQLYRWVETAEQDGIIIPGHPQYNRTLLRFINDVYESDLLIADYKHVLSQYRTMDVDTLISGADFTLLRAILTYYVRGEHAISGLWGRGVRKKCFLRILDRLCVLSITA